MGLDCTLEEYYRSFMKTVIGNSKTFLNKSIGKHPAKQICLLYPLIIIFSITKVLQIFQLTLKSEAFG